MRAALCALTAVILSALPFAAGAQTLPVGYPVSPAAFQEDTNGYGRALLDGLMPQYLGRMAKMDAPTRLLVAQIALNNDGQPEFAVRIENRLACDTSGCNTFVFMLQGGAWKPVFQTRAVSLGVGPVDPSSGLAELVVGQGPRGGQDRWAFDGKRYDLVQ